jgi:hypothetical protein
MPSFAGNTFTRASGPQLPSLQVIGDPPSPGGAGLGF